MTAPMTRDIRWENVEAEIQKEETNVVADDSRITTFVDYHIRIAITLDGKKHQRVLRASAEEWETMYKYILNRMVAELDRALSERGAMW